MIKEQKKKEKKKKKSCENAMCVGYWKQTCFFVGLIVNVLGTEKCKPVKLIKMISNLQLYKKVVQREWADHLCGCGSWTRHMPLMLN